MLQAQLNGGWQRQYLHKAVQRVVFTVRKRISKLNTQWWQIRSECSSSCKFSRDLKCTTNNRLTRCVWYSLIVSHAILIHPFASFTIWLFKNFPERITSMSLCFSAFFKLCLWSLIWYVRAKEQSKEIGKYLMLGWKMLGEYCPATGAVPLMQVKPDYPLFYV